MAKKAPKNDSAAYLAADDGAVIPRISLSETGFIGLRTINHQIIESPNRAFRFPSILKTIHEMSNDATISSAVNVYRMFLSRVKWSVEAPVGATDEQIARAKFVAQCMEDMEHSWGSFIVDVIEYLWYGFSIQEKVFRRRLRKNGSKYNDGLVGLRKVAPRGQDTIRNWIFDDSGRNLLAVEQSLVNLESGYRYIDLQTGPDGLITIPREKFLLFSADSTKSNPQGKSLFQGIYLSWKQMMLLKDQEILGITKDAAGLPLIQIPPKYMAPDALPADKAVYDMCKTIINNLAAGTQRGIIFPAMADPETKQPLFSVELLERRGIPAASIDAVIKRYKDEVLSALSVDILKSGQDAGSFSLQDGDTNILSIALSHRLTEIAEALNNDLIPQLFQLNGWTDTDLPKFVPSDISSVSLEELSKFLQRTGSIGLLEVDRPTLNKVRTAAGISPKPDDEPVDKENLTMAGSKAGAGMAPGTVGNGTAKTPATQDGSANNADNKA